MSQYEPDELGKPAIHQKPRMTSRSTQKNVAGVLESSRHLAPLFCMFNGGANMVIFPLTKESRSALSAATMEAKKRPRLRHGLGLGGCKVHSNQAAKRRGKGFLFSASVK